MLDVSFQKCALFILCWVVRFCEGIGLFCVMIVVAPFSLKIVSTSENRRSRIIVTYKVVGKLQARKISRCVLEIDNN